MAQTIKVSFAFETEGKIVKGNDEALTIQLPVKITRLIGQLEKEFSNRGVILSYV